MKFLLDENIAQSFLTKLRLHGFTVIHILDVGLGGTDDENILAFANQKKLIIITHDKDFGNLVRFPAAKHHGVILLRFRNQNSDNVFPYLLDFIQNHSNLKSRLVIMNEFGFRMV